MAGARRIPALIRRPGVAGAPPPEQIHVQFGADAASQIAVSWAAPAPAARPRLRVGPAGDGYGREVQAEERVCTEALTGEIVHTYHARLAGLPPDTAFGYQVIHDGARPVAGTFRTGPRGRGSRFRFTSFGDHSIPAPVGRGLGPHTPNAGYIVDAVDALDPLHQVAMSSARLNGADLGIRRELLPLFDTYGVDLVVAGHEHHYERTFPVRGVLAGGLLTPAPRGSDPAEMDTRDGTVHMIIGGGGHSVLRPAIDPGTPPQGVLIIGAGPGSPQSQRRSVIAAEPAPWSAYRDLATPFGFASFDVVPAEPGGTTSITVTYHGAAAGSRVYAPLDRFVLRKPVGARRRPRARHLVTG